MNLGFRQIITVLAALLFPIIMPAQDLPVLPSDPAVLNGVAPNGMAYYLVSNPTVKGVADFALVQRTGRLTAEDSTGMEAVGAARKTLSSSKRLPLSGPYGFAAAHNVAPGRDGFVKVTDDATIFRFSEVRLNAVDSTLLVLMDMADRSNFGDDEFYTKWYSPADQAVIVSGDIDPKSLETKLRNMSYMIPAAESAARPDYSAMAARTGGVMVLERNDGLAEISATWTSKRAPREYMNTVQPEIFEMFLNTLGPAAVGRIRKTLKGMDIPAADVSYGHICSSSYPYDDSFTVSVIVEAKDTTATLEAIAGVMSSIDNEGLGTDEYVLAESFYFQELADMASVREKSNAEYVDRCMNAFLYNSSLASPKERMNFHKSGNLPDTTRLRLFNGIAGALLDDSLWTVAPAADVAAVAVNMDDTLTFPGPGAKVKLKSAKKEPVSGGQVWTFSNGFKVIYKRMKTDRMFYNLALNGGFSSMEGMEEGEGAFLADYLRTCHVNGLKGEDFLNVLRRENVTMDFAVSMSNTMISGSLPENRIQLLLRSLLAVANARTPDEASFAYYRDCEYLSLDMAQGGAQSRMTEIDNIMSPNYKYSPYKQKGKITGDFITNAETFFNDRFARMNDGALILVGDMDEDKLKKVLTAYVSNFRTMNEAVRRPVVRYQPVSGWSTYTVEGESDNVDVVISTRMPLTMDNFIASDLATMILRSSMAKELDKAGMYFTMSTVCRINPEERFNMMISVSSVPEDGFPVGMSPKTPIEALAYVRSALAELHTIEITGGELNQYKETLKHSIAQQMNSPEYWVHAIALRYLDGKDFSTSYASRIDAVTPDKVMSIFNLLDAGCKVEYVTTKKD